MTEDFRGYQIRHMGIQKELDELKARKKELKQDIRLGKECIGENTMTAFYEVDEQEKLEYGISTDIPERSRWEGGRLQRKLGLDITESQNADMGIYLGVNR